MTERQTHLIRVGIAAIRLREAEEDDARHRRDSQRFDRTIRCCDELNEAIAAWRRFVAENP